MARAQSPLLGAHDDHRRYPFLRRTIDVPEPLAFPREALAGAADEHGRMLERFCKTAAFPHEDRDSLSTTRCVDVAAGLVMRFDNGNSLQTVVPRSTIIRVMRLYRGVCVPLFTIPREEWTLPVVVSAAGAVSLNYVYVQHRPSRPMPSLSIVARDVVLEPLEQRTWATETLQRSTITEWRSRDDEEPRYAWVPTPEDPLDEVEMIDRLARSYEASSVQAVQEHLARGFSAREILVTLVSTHCCGDSFQVMRRDCVGAIAANHPTIARAIERDADPRRVPVFVVTERFGGLRWLILEPGRKMALETSGALTARTIMPVDPNLTLEFTGPNTPRPYYRSAGIEGEVEDLVGLTQAELQAEMILAGFEPSVERVYGPGVRATVVSAIAARRAAAASEGAGAQVAGEGACHRAGLDPTAAHVQDGA